MRDAIPLQYARRIRRLTRRRTVTLALTVAALTAASYLGHQGYREIRRRMALLDGIGRPQARWRAGSVS